MPSLDIGLSLIQILVLFAILPGICEALLFRGTIQGLLRQSTPAGARCIIVGALFGFPLELGSNLTHWNSGVLLCFTAWRAQSLFVPIFIHILHNGVVLVLSHHRMLETTPEVPYLVGGSRMLGSVLAHGPRKITVKASPPSSCSAGLNR